MDPATPAGARRYRAYGLRIASGIPLDPFLAVDPEEAPPDVTIDVGIPSDLALGPTDVEFAYPEAARVLARGGRLAFVAAEASAGPGLLAEFVAGPVLASLMEQRGAFVLHASAVAVGGRVVAFAGPSGMGKSTTAAFFAARGYPLITDDLLPLWVDGASVSCDAGPNALKLSDAAGRAVPEFREAFTMTGKSLRAPQQPRPGDAARHLAAIYVLEDAETVSTRTLSGQAAIAALLQQAFCLALVGPARRGAHLRRCAEVARRAPVRVLGRPRDLSAGDAILEKVISELARPTSTGSGD